MSWERPKGALIKRKRNKAKHDQQLFTCIQKPKIFLSKLFLSMLSKNSSRTFSLKNLC